MTRVTILSANLGGYDVPQAWPVLDVPPGVALTVRRLTDADLPPRPLAMTSRLLCGVPKWFGSDFAPDADVIIWTDASCTPTAGAVAWWLAHLTGPLAVFRHPHRTTIAEEYAFMRDRLNRPGETYLTSRYAHEWLDAQYAAIAADRLTGLPLYASTAFAYRPRLPRVVDALREVFLWKARYLLHDQLAWPWVLHRHALVPAVIPESYLHCDALTFTRPSQRRRVA